MDYKRKLVDLIKNPDKWPSIDRPDFLIELNVVADEAFGKDTVEGYLASLLIYHQLCEELIRLIIRDSQLFIQLSIFPTEINFVDKKKLMFGQLIEDLKSTISFDGKDEFIRICQEINKHRIDIVHNLTRRSTLKDIRQQVSRVQELYETAYELFEDVHDEFRLDFSRFRKNVDWEELMDDS